MAKEYEVIHIDQLTRMSETQGLEPYYRIRFKTKGGVVLTTDVDEKDYIEEKVAVILIAEAQKTDKILALGG